MRKLTNEELQRITVEEFKSSQKVPLVIVLDNVRSMLNVGSIFRTADAFLLEAVYLCGITGTPPNREIEKTALGATKTVVWKYFSHTQEAIALLKENGYKVYALEQAERALGLDEFIPAVKTAFVFGHEIKGVEQDTVDRCDGCIEVPQLGTKHSLNVAVCVGIAAWDLYCKLKK